MIPMYIQLLIHLITPPILVGISIYLLERYTKLHPLIIAVLTFFVLLFYITFRVFENHLWVPSAGLEVLFEMVYIFASTFLLFIVFLIMAKYQKIKKSAPITAITLSIISPFLFYAVALTLHDYKLSQYYSTYCFKYEKRNYYMTFNSNDSSTFIFETHRSGSRTQYFNGKYSQRNDTIYLNGWKSNISNTFVRQSYLIVNNRIIDFMDNSTEVIIKECSKPEDSSE